jgi:alcohol dehydrogenase (cytochrome c)
VDGTDEHVLADLVIDGQMRKVMIQSNKNGFMYVLDRTNCKLIAAHPYTRVNWASGIDLATGRPLLTGIYKDFLAGQEVEILPSRGSNAVPIAFNPVKKLVYATPWDLPRIQQLAPPKPQVIGEGSTGVNARQPRIEPRQVVGHYIAMDPLTGQRKWEVPLTDMPSSAGMLVTGGGLVFTGKPTGEFVALDEDTGQMLWQFQTSSSVNSTAITYTHRGRQHVTVASGLGGGLARRAVGNAVPAGGSLWTFAIMPE